MQAASNYLNDTLPTTGKVVAENEYKVRLDGSTMHALTWQSSNKVQVKTVGVPTITQPKDVVLKVTGSTICGSDLHLYHGEIVALKKNDILGHEFMGIVDEVGPEVKKLQKGDRVVVSFQIACGECSFCQQKLSSMCERTNASALMGAMYGSESAKTNDAGFFGYSHFTGGFPGGQAEYVRVPIADVNCLKVPDDVPDEDVLYLSDVIPTSYHAVVDTGVRKGDVVGVWGLGPIGQCVVRFAFLKGAKRVIAIDAVPERLEMARKAGAEVINFKEVKDIPGKIYEMVDIGLDVAIDCGTFHEPKSMLHKAEKALMLETDSSEIHNEMIKSVRKMGRCGVIAAYAGFTNHFNIGALMEKASLQLSGIRFIGNGQAPVQKYWEELLYDYIIPKKFDPKFMISHRVPIEEMDQLYAAFDARVGGVEKVFVQTRFSNPPAPGAPQLSHVEDWAK